MPMGSGSGEGRRAGAEARGYGGGRDIGRSRTGLAIGRPQTSYAGPPNMQDLALRGMKTTTAGARDALTGAGPFLNGLRALAPVKSMSLTDLIQQMTGYMGTAPTMNQGQGPGGMAGMGGMGGMAGMLKPGLMQGGMQQGPTPMPPMPGQSNQLNRFAMPPKPFGVMPGYGSMAPGYSYFGAFGR